MHRSVGSKVSQSTALNSSAAAVATPFPVAEAVPLLLRSEHCAPDGRGVIAGHSRASACLSAAAARPVIPGHASFGDVDGKPANPLWPGRARSEGVAACFGWRCHRAVGWPARAGVLRLLLRKQSKADVSARRPHGSQTPYRATEGAGTETWDMVRHAAVSCTANTGVCIMLPMVLANSIWHASVHGGLERLPLRSTISASIWHASIHGGSETRRTSLRCAAILKVDESLP